MKEAIQICTEVLLHPFESYHKKLKDGGCESYPDPASPLARRVIPRAVVENMTFEDVLKAGHPWTIGWGTTGPDIVPGLIWTKEQADSRFESDVKKFAIRALNLSPGLVHEPPRRFAAIISFCYNCGTGSYRISTLRKRVNEKNWIEAAQEIKKWDKAQGIKLRGLTLRRNAEAMLLL